MQKRTIKDKRWPNRQYECWEVFGHGIRRRFKKEIDARDFRRIEENKLRNILNRTHTVETSLTREQIEEAESAFKRLGERYTLAGAVDFYLKHNQAADFKITLAEAVTRFRGAMEGQVRNRTLIQLKSTLHQFEKFAQASDLGGVTEHEVEGFLRSIRARDGISPASPKTWNNFRGELSQFFDWCIEGWSKGDDGKLRQNRWISRNPAANVKRLKYENGHVTILPLARAQALMNYLAEHKGGKLVRYFSLALFAGVRPGGELEKLANYPDLIDLDNQVIRITPAISKTGKARQIKIRENLRRWLGDYPSEIFPRNCDREFKAVRKTFGLGHDICRHSFISYHIGAFKEFATAALESGNSESIIKDHYLNTSSFRDARAFWEIVPPVPGEAKAAEVA
ncbi:MAG: hypothetical protein JO170_25005 [Verrucomicrobia bacterium]|nr:hypothetical protein [Verrucomicrobiota bacterium]